MTKLPTTGVNVATEAWQSRCSIPWRLGACVAIAVTATTLYLSADGAARGSAAPLALVSPATVTPDLPGDITGGAPNTTLEQAAIFAWQEFIALNWPAAKTQRGAPDRSARFGAGGPVVWETYRHKVEIFPGYGVPHGNGNYDDAPQYTYNPTVVGEYPQLPAGGVPSCNGTESAAPPFINLDEDSQITFNRTFARPRGNEAAPRQVLFLAKANRTHFDYINANKWFLLNVPPFAETTAFVAANHRSAPPGNSALVSFPNGTIEVKAAWRRLTREEAGSGRFYTAPVRLYRYQEQRKHYGGGKGKGDPTKSCYVDEAAGSWGLMGLHIIHKTPSAPYFIYATFEQADNLLDASGDPLEDPAGKIIGALAPTPFDPDIASVNATGGGIATPASVQTLTAIPQAGGVSSYGMHFVESPCAYSAPQGPIHVNQRMHAIPQTIIAVNREVQAVIQRYSPSAPWQYYKLVNVQYRPIDKPVPGKDYDGDDSASYHQANIVVESDYNLQMFSGSFQPGTQDDENTVVSLDTPVHSKNINNLITDFSADGKVFKNVQYSGASYNMGGCMGCHGNIQALGADFSFLLANGPVDGPRPEHARDHCTPAIIDKAAQGAYRGTAAIYRRRHRPSGL